jgi:hypothetical protein
MKALLSAITARLKAQVTAATDVIVLPDRALLPQSSRFPVIALKDGQTDLAHGAAESYEDTLHVEVSIYQDIIQVEACVMGNSATTGLLDLMAKVRAALDGWDTGAYFGCRCLAEEPSELIAIGKTMKTIVGKTAHFEWYRTGQTGG